MIYIVNKYSDLSLIQTEMYLQSNGFDIKPECNGLIAAQHNDSIEQKKKNIFIEL